MQAWPASCWALRSPCITITVSPTHHSPPPRSLPPLPLPPDDLWSLDLNKLDGWKCVKENTVGEEAFRDLSSDEWETGSESE